jgi:hypothetical protein
MERTAVARSTEIAHRPRSRPKAGNFRISGEAHRHFDEAAGEAEL